MANEESKEELDLEKAKKLTKKELLDLLEKQQKKDKDRVTTQKKILDMTKEEYETHMKIQSTKAQSIAATMQLAAANGDIVTALEQRDELQKQIEKTQKEVEERALSLAQENEQFNEIVEEKIKLQKELKDLTGDDADAARELLKELEGQEQAIIEQTIAGDSRLQQNAELLRSYYEQTEILDEQLGVFSDLGKEGAKVATKVKGAAMGVGELAFGLMDVEKTGIGAFQGLAVEILANDEGIKGFKAGLLSAFSAANIGATMFTKVFESATMMLKSLDETSTKFAAATGTGEQYQSMLENIVQSNVSMGVGFENASKGLQGLLENQIGFVDMSKTLQQELAAQAGMLERIGVGADVSADLMNTFSKTMGLGAEDAMGLTKNLAMMGGAIGVSSQKMIKDFQNANKTLAVYGKQGVKSFQNLAAAAKAAGVEMDSLLGIAGKFDTFEDAADTVGKLNAVLGANMSATEMLMMTEDKRIETVIQQMQVNGESFAQMDRFKQKALANAVGISDMAEANRIFGMSMSQYRNYSSQLSQSQLTQEKWKEAIQATVPIQEKLQAIIIKWAPKMTEWLDIVTTTLDKMLHFFDMVYEKTNGMFPYVVMGFGAIAVAITGMLAVVRAWHEASVIGKVIQEGGFKAAIKKAAGIKVETLATDDNTRSQGMNNNANKVGIGTRIKSIGLWIKERVQKGFNTVATWLGIGAEKTQNIVRKDTVKTNKLVSKSQKGMGASMLSTAAAIAAVGVALIGVGLGIKFAAEGFAALATAMGAMNQNLGAFVAVVFIVTAGMVAMTFALAGMGAVSAKAALPILAVGAALFLIGASIAIAAYGASLLVKSFKGAGEDGLMMAVALGIITLSLNVMLITLMTSIPALIGFATAAAGAGASAWLLAGPILAIGAAIMLMGLGLMLAFKGAAELVLAFKGIGTDGLYAVASILALSAAMIIMSLVLMKVGVPALISFATTAGVTAPAIWAVAGAILAIGAGVALAALGMGQMFKGAAVLVTAFKGMGNEAYYAAFGLQALTLSFAGLLGVMALIGLSSKILLGFAGVIGVLALAMGAMVFAFNMLNTENLNAVAAGLQAISQIISNAEGMEVGVSFIGTLARDIESLGTVTTPEIQNTLDSLVAISANQTSEQINNNMAETRAEAQFQLTQNLKNELDITVKIGDTTFIDHVKKVVRDEIDWMSAEMQQTSANIVIAGDE